MKRGIDRISQLFRTEIQTFSLILSTMRRHKHNAATILFISFIIFLSGRVITEAHLPGTLLRGGYTSYAPVGQSNNLGTKPIAIGKFHGIKRTWAIIGDKIGSQTKNKEASSNHLDEVLSAFRRVLNGSEIDTAQLLKACRSHLKLMKSGGASLRLVAKDLESNLLKAEKPFKKAPKEGKTLYSLLERERRSGIHEGNELENESAAMGLLWIRRSLAFQLDLFETSIVSKNSKPGDAAIHSYEKNLSPYHGWMLQKMFPLSLSAMPQRSAFISAFGGKDEPISTEYEAEIVNKVNLLLATWRPIIKRWTDDFQSLNLEDTRPA